MTTPPEPGLYPDRVPAPDPGVYPGVPSANYHLWDAVSPSGMKDARKSAKRYRYLRDHPGKDSAALKFGRAFHGLAFEPDDFGARFAKAPSGKGSVALAASMAEEGITTIAADSWEKLIPMRDAVFAHESARALLDQATAVECSAVAVFEGMGALENQSLPCKARVDGLCELASTVFELKTADDSDEEPFSRDINNYGYHRTAAQVLDVLAGAGLEIEHYIFIAVTKSAPFEVDTYPLEPASIDLGRLEKRKALDLIADCRAAKEWPQRSEKLRPIGCPPWAFKKANLW